MGVGWFISLYYGSSTILYIFVAIAMIINFYSYWKSDKLVIKLTKAREIKRKEYFDFWNSAENISISIGAPMPKLYVIEDPSPNAFATGRNPEHSAVVVTSGLLDILDKKELEGVIAHEIAHIQNRDTLLMTVVVALIGAVTIALDFIIHSVFWSRSDNKHPFLYLVAIVLYFVVPIFLALMKFAISRKREFLADATGAIYTRYPEGLASALQKIKNYGKPLSNANSATAHLFISDPFLDKEDEGKKYSISKLHKLFSTHPPVEERIQALLNSG